MTTLRRQSHTPPAAFPAAATMGQHGAGSVSCFPVGCGDELAAYFRDLEAFPVLSEEAEHDLTRRLMRGDGSAQQQLITHNLRLVVSIAHHYANHGMELKDLVQEGNIGLMRAAEKFDAHKGFRFSTYASWWINQAIARAIDERGSLIHIPTHVHYQELNPLKRARTRLLQENGEEPGVEELAKTTGIAATRIVELLRAAGSIISCDQPMSAENDLLVAETLRDDNAELLEDTVITRVLASEIRTQMQATLPPRQYAVLYLRYGLDGTCIHKVPEIAKKLGISPQRVCQLEASALRALRSSPWLQFFREGLKIFDPADDTEARP